MPKANKGSSMPNQGDRRTSMRVSSNGDNVPVAGYSKPAKQDAKRWKSKGKKNPSLPDWLA
jgi:hypothetical protein